MSHWLPFSTYHCNLEYFPMTGNELGVTPIYKDGSKTECGNYRPISVTSIVAKIFEKLVCGQLRSCRKIISS